MVVSLDPSTARRWGTRALASLASARQELDALNVYPVADHDTGTNLYLTFDAAATAVSEASLPSAPGPVGALGRLCGQFADGALLGARGNCGTILSEVLRGWADEFAGLEAADARQVAAALSRGAEYARRAVARPVEGTMLTVLGAAGEAARAAAADLPSSAATCGPTPGGDPVRRLPDEEGLAVVVTAAARAARVALGETTGQLEQLASAGVVDAGGRGVVVLLDALAGVVAEQPDPPVTDGRDGGLRRSGASDGPFSGHGHARAPGGPEFEVMYLLDLPVPFGAPPGAPQQIDAVDGLRAELDRLGDSVVVVGGGPFHVHVHTDDAGAAVEAGVRVGRPRRVRITRLAQGATPAVAAARQLPQEPPRHPPDVLLLACAAGPGLARIFERSGAVVVASQAGRRPTVGDLQEALNRVAHRAVVVLPNDPRTERLAREVARAREGGPPVLVLRTLAQVQGLAAAAVHQPGRDLAEDVAQMSAAAGATRHGAVTVSTREGMTSGGPCRPGDALGVLDGDLALVGPDLTSVACDVVTRLLASGGELLTIVTGQDVPPGLLAAVRQAATDSRWDVEVQVVDGGQPGYPLLFGVE